jgi:hypothetical protein
MGRAGAAQAKSCHKAQTAQIVHPFCPHGDAMFRQLTGGYISAFPLLAGANWFPLRNRQAQAEPVPRVSRADLSPEPYLNSVQLREWVLRNKNQKHVPSDLLKPMDSRCAAITAHPCHESLPVCRQGIE